jgi:hypothetical protein
MQLNALIVSCIRTGMDQIHQFDHTDGAYPWVNHVHNHDIPPKKHDIILGIVVCPSVDHLHENIKIQQLVF